MSLSPFFLPAIWYYLVGVALVVLAITTIAELEE